MSLAAVAVPLLGKLENGFQMQPAQRWMKTYWLLSLPVGIVYVATIFTLREMMKRRKPFGLRTSLTMWNTGLAVFSFIGATSLLPDLIWNMKTYGLAYGNCFREEKTTQRVLLWSWLFSLSKIIELGDTLFVVLRKAPLMFLHWYHHVTVLVYCWYSIKEVTEMGIWFGGMNYLIHTIMYSYYALKASGRRLPSIISQLITLLQITQMCLGVTLNIISLRKDETFGCDVRYDLVYFGLTIYGSYMILFGNFFYQRYIRANKQP